MGDSAWLRSAAATGLYFAYAPPRGKTFPIVRGE